MRATKFDFVINLKTAKALGLCIAAGVFAIANVPSAIPLPAPLAAAHYGASDLVLWPDCMVRPCGARGFFDLVDAVLHYCIRPLLGAVAPGHHGYQRACDLIPG
jgi:hypothetical protein